MALIHRKTKAKQHRMTDQDADRDASDLFNGTRYKQTNALHDLNKTIAYVEHVTKVMPKGHSQTPELLVGYAKWLVERYNKTWKNDLRDLSETIHLIEEVLSTAVPTHHDRAPLLGHLNDWLGMRYDRAGNQVDLGQAIEASRLAIGGLHDGCGLLPWLLIGLGNRLSIRFQATSNDADIVEAIGRFENWLAYMPPDDANRHVLNNLGPCRGMKYERSNDIGDLDRAIYYSELAVESLASDRSNEAPLLTNLGNLLL